MGHPQTGPKTRSSSHNEDPATVLPVYLLHSIAGEPRNPPLNAYTVTNLSGLFMPFDRGKIFAHIDKNLSQHIAKLQELIRQPSISPENKGVRECANLILNYLTSLGCKEASL